VILRIRIEQQTTTLPKATCNGKSSSPSLSHSTLLLMSNVMSSLKFFVFVRSEDLMAEMSDDKSFFLLEDDEEVGGGGGISEETKRVKKLQLQRCFSLNYKL